MRKVSRSGEIPTGGSGSADSGFIEDYAREDHIHQLFELGWQELAPKSPWTGDILFTRSGNLFMVYVEVQNLGAAQIILCEDPLLATLRSTSDVTAIAGIWQDPFDGAFRKAALRFTNTQLTANGIDSTPASINITQSNFVSGHALFRT